MLTEYTHVKTQGKMHHLIDESARDSTGEEYTNESPFHW